MSESPSFSEQATVRVPCNVCLADDATPFAVAAYRFIEGDFQIVRCTRCGFVYVNPRLPRSEIEDDYISRPFPSEEIIRSKHEGQLAFHQFMVRKIERFFPAGRRASLRWVELGSGWGGLLIEADRRGHRVEGVEISYERAAYVNERLGLPIHRGDVFDAPYPARGYDVVYSQATLEHVDDPRANLLAMREWLSDDGLLAVTVPNLDFIGGRVKDGRMTDDPRHLSHFTVSTFGRLLRDTGFEIAEISGGFPLFGVWRRLVRSPGAVGALAAATLRLTAVTSRGSEIFAFARRAKG